MDRLIETLLLATRWLLLPLYVGLVLAVLSIYVVVARETWHLIGVMQNGTDSEFVLVILSELDLVLVANLLVMVAVSSYESFISRIKVGANVAQPEWLGKLDSDNVKLKVGLSILTIAAIHLLREYMMDASSEQMLPMAAVLLVFTAAVLVVAVVDRLHRTTR